MLDAGCWMLDAGCWVLSDINSSPCLATDGSPRKASKGTVQRLLPGASAHIATTMLTGATDYSECLNPFRTIILPALPALPALAWHACPARPAPLFLLCPVLFFTGKLNPHYLSQTLPVTDYSECSEADLLITVNVQLTGEALSKSA